MQDIIWTKVTINVPSSMEDSVADFLITLTGQGVGITEGQGVSTIDAYLYPGEVEDNLLLVDRHLEDLVEMGFLPEGAGYEIGELPEEDWMAVFRSQHETVRISPRLILRPTWCEPADEIEIVLDPGMAFGTGNHSTTRMCLILLDRVAKKPLPERMFDLGTGSGILAIAGARLGIADILAVDIDGSAVQVALKNTIANKVEKHIRVEEGSVVSAQGQYDVIAANISASLLERFAPSLASHLKPGGRVILSGILEDEWPKLSQAYRDQGLVEEEVMLDKVWVAALLVSRTGNE